MNNEIWFPFYHFADLASSVGDAVIRFKEMTGVSLSTDEKRVMENAKDISLVITVHYDLPIKEERMR